VAVLSLQAEAAKWLKAQLVLPPRPQPVPCSPIYKGFADSCSPDITALNLLNFLLHVRPYF